MFFSISTLSIYLEGISITPDFFNLLSFAFFLMAINGPASRNIDTNLSNVRTGHSTDLSKSSIDQAAFQEEQLAEAELAKELAELLEELKSENLINSSYFSELEDLIASEYALSSAVTLSSEYSQMSSLSSVLYTTSSKNSQKLL